MALYEISTKADEINFEIGNDALKRTIQNCKNLLMTRKGEVPFDRTRGLDMRLFSLPDTEMREALLPELDRVMMWEPDAEVVGARTAVEDGETVLYCTIKV